MLSRCKNAQSSVISVLQKRVAHTKCDHKGLGLSQRARFGESGFDPDRNTAHQVLEPSTGALLAKC